MFRVQTKFAFKTLAAVILAAGALHCGGPDEPGMESGDDALRAWGPWGSCTLIRDGIKVPAYYDAATGCCCYKGDCEIQPRLDTIGP